MSTARPITFPPKVPASGKERKRMLKATAFRLGRLISVPCAVLVETDAAKLFLIVQSRFAGVRHDPDAGEARRLATKFLRLRHSTKA